VRGVYDERGLADPGHPADRVKAHHHVARPRQLLKFLLPPGERGHVTRKRPHARRSAGGRYGRHGPTPRNRPEPRPGQARQVQRVGQQPGRAPRGWSVSSSAASRTTATSRTSMALSRRTAEFSARATMISVPAMLATTASA